MLAELGLHDSVCWNTLLKIGVKDDLIVFVRISICETYRCASAEDTDILCWTCSLFECKF